MRSAAATSWYAGSRSRRHSSSMHGCGSSTAGRRGKRTKPEFSLDARLRLEPGEDPLELGTRVQAHHGTRESAARVYPLGDDYMQLRLEQPFVALRGDHVILRRVAPPDTIGGAVVSEPPARRHSARPGVVERLRAIEVGGDPEAMSPQPDGQGAGAGQRK